MPTSRIKQLGLTYTFGGKELFRRGNERAGSETEFPQQIG